MYFSTQVESEKRDRRHHGIRVAMLTFILSFFMTALSANAQTSVTGTVTDETGEPLIGASVVVPGSTIGASTDIDGNFKLNVAQGKKIRVSYVGYVTQEVTVKGNNLKIVLKEDNELLDEVVVIGYGTMKKKDLTGSITTVNSKDLNVGSYTDPGQLLQGKVPGLVVVQNSDPNGGVNSLTLRGASTLRNDGASPLYVVDGIPGVDLNLIPPADIESIDVLRDASATAIYGSKAANGVIIVTTKRGSEGKANVSYQGYVSWDRIANDHKMMTGDELRAYAKEVGANLDYDLGYNTNWQDEVQRTGFAHNHNISISGGGKNTTYNASVNYIARDGVIRGSGNNLFTARAYVETKMLKERLLLGVGINGNIRNEWGVNDRDANDGKAVYNAMYYYSPLVPAKNEDGSWYSHGQQFSKNYNPLAMLYENTSRKDFKRYQVTGKAQFKIIDGLFLNANFSYQNNNWNYKAYRSHKVEFNNVNGYAERSNATDINKLMEIYGNWDKTFKDVHKVALMAGYSWEQGDYNDGFGAKGYNYYDDSLGWDNIGAANSWTADPVWANVKWTKRMISFYGRANYSYDSKYLFQAAIRRDGASVFGSNSKWGTFPSASVAWRLSEEEWLRPLGEVGDFKIRVGWGKSGNSEGFDAYRARFYYEMDGGRFSDPVTGEENAYKYITAARNQNDNLKWETTSMLNVGLDFSFLGGRINGVIEYYNKDTRDMIWAYPVSTTKYPVGSLDANVGRMRNRGVEVTINAVPIQGPFTWSTSLNFSHNKNKIVSISDPSAGFTTGVLDRYNPSVDEWSNFEGCAIQRIIEGQPIGTFFTYDWAGYNENGQSIFYTYDKTFDDTFGNRCVDENGNYVTVEAKDLKPKDRVIVGNAQPKLTMGWNNNFSWKNWDLNLFFTGVFGQKIYNEPREYFGYVQAVNLGRNVLADIRDFQKLTDAGSQAPSSRWVEDGSYFKLATVTLGYTFRNCFNGWLRDVRVYVSANNVFTITGYKGRDPEINLAGETPGIDSRHDHYPRTRQILVGLNVNF